MLELAVLGLATGALYVLMALGIVIVHRGSGVVNFAHGAVGMFGTFVYWWADTDWGFASVPAAILGVLTSAAIGLAIHFVAMRPLRRAALLSRVIATLAVLTILQEGAALLYQGPSIVVRSILPSGKVEFAGATVGQDRVLILGLACVVVAVLVVVYQRTQFGRATAAAAENGIALAALGWSPDRIAALNWVIGSAMAGLTGVLLAPITGISVIGLTLLVVPALAAAVVGRLTSLPLTMLGGLLIGVVQAFVGRYVDAIGWVEAVPFIIIVVALLLRGPDRSIRVQVAARLPRLGSGRLRPTVVVIWFVIALGVIFWGDPAWNDAFVTTMGTALIVLSVVVVTGYSGQLSLAQISFAGWGAWVAGELARSHDLAFPLALLVGAASAMPLGLLVGAVCLRIRGANLAIATLGLAVAIDALVFRNPERTNNGTFVVPAPHVGPIDVSSILHPHGYAVVVLVVFTVAALAVANLRRGRSGRRMVAVRSNERAAASLGIGIVQAKLSAFALSSVIAAAGGVLLAFRNPNIVFTDYPPERSIALVGFAVVGGVGFVPGSVYGGFMELGSLGTKLLDLLGDSVGQYVPLIGGALLLVVLVTAPDGLAAQAVDAIRQLRSRTRPSDASVPDLDRGVEGHRVSARTLRIEGLSVRFGGVRALDAVSLHVAPGEVVGLIGPNGAGKTTLIDAATGYLGKVRGSVTLDGIDLSGMSTSRRSCAGLTRSFQSSELFDDMTVLDNLRAASEPRDLKAVVTDLFAPRTPRLSAATIAAIKVFDLEPHLESLPSELPYSVRRLVGIARAVATEASIVMLDEPAAGLDDEEVTEFGSLIRRLATEWGIGFLLVEHNMSLVMSLADRVYALNFGQLIAAGTPAEVQNDQGVVEAYLGV